MSERPSDRTVVAFDQHSVEHAKTWPEVYQDLRTRCPHAWSEAHGGFWIASRYEDVIKIAQRPESFSTAKSFDRQTGAVSGGVSMPPVPGFRSIPNEIDPPEWKFIRDLLNPLFGPKAAEARRENARRYASALVDTFIERGELDIVSDYTSPLMGIVTMEIIGFPLTDWREVSAPMRGLGNFDHSEAGLKAAAQSFEPLRDRIDREFARRTAEPKDDLLGFLAAAVKDGAPLSAKQIQEITIQMIGGGHDTTTTLTSHALIYLGRHPEERQRLIDDPSLVPLAREEFLRWASPLHGLARTVAEDVDVDGWRMGKGERVFLAYSSANRDPTVFERPEEVIIDRKPNRHIAFGAGIHRCLGSFVARIMFDVMVDEILRRLPDYKPVEARLRPTPTVGGVNGWISAPATFTPGARLDPVTPDWAR